MHAALLLVWDHGIVVNAIQVVVVVVLFQIIVKLGIHNVVDHHGILQNVVLLSVLHHGTAVGVEVHIQLMFQMDAQLQKVIVVLKVLYLKDVVKYLVLNILMELIVFIQHHGTQQVNF